MTILASREAWILLFKTLKPRAISSWATIRKRGVNLSRNRRWIRWNVKSLSGLSRTSSSSSSLCYSWNLANILNITRSSKSSFTDDYPGMNNNIADYVRKQHPMITPLPPNLTAIGPRFKDASDFFNRGNIALIAEKPVSLSNHPSNVPRTPAPAYKHACTCVYSWERKKSSRSRGRQVQKETDAVNAYDVILRFAEIRRISNIETCISAGKHLFNSRYSRSLSIRPESRPIPIPPLSHLSSYSASLRLFDISRERASQRRAITGEMQFDRRRCARARACWCSGAD